MAHARAAVSRAARAPAALPPTPHTDFASWRGLPAHRSRSGFAAQRVHPPARCLQSKSQQAGPDGDAERPQQKKCNRFHCFATSRASSSRKNSAPNDAASPALGASTSTARIGALAAPLRRSYPLFPPSRYAPGPLPAVGPRAASGVARSERAPCRAQSRRARRRSGRASRKRSARVCEAAPPARRFATVAAEMQFVSTRKPKPASATTNAPAPVEAMTATPAVV